MSLVINHPTRGDIKIKTFDKNTISTQKKRDSLKRIISVVSKFVDQMNEKPQELLTPKETAFCNLGILWRDSATVLYDSESYKNELGKACESNKIIQIAKIGETIEGFSSLTSIPGALLQK